MIIFDVSTFGCCGMSSNYLRHHIKHIEVYVTGTFYDGAVSGLLQTAKNNWCLSIPSIDFIIS